MCPFCCTNEELKQLSPGDILGVTPGQREKDPELPVCGESLDFWGQGDFDPERF